MYKWLQKNNKRLLAFIAVFLMIAFLAPTTFNGCDHSRTSIGKMDGVHVNVMEVQRARQEFEYAARNLLIDAPGTNSPDGVVSILNVLFPRAAAAQIDEHQILYYLLREEARSMGAAPSPQLLDEALARINIRLPDGRRVLYENIKETNEGRFARQTLSNVLSVSAAFVRARNDIKVTEPQRRADMAMQFQSLSLKLVDFPSNAFDDKVAPITPEQLEEHFQKYAHLLPGEKVSTENPFGFGYKLPDRVAVQFISVDRGQIRQAVLDNPQNGATPEDRAYFWEVEARKFYNANKHLFATTQPTTTQPSTQPAAMETSPFEAVRQAATEEVLRPQVDRLARMVQQRIVTGLNNDFATFAKAGPATAPATTLGPAFNTFDYLQALAADVQRQFGFLPTIVNVADSLKSAEQLDALAGIRDASAMVQGRQRSFAEYATQFAEAFTANATEREQAYLLKLYQPSQTLTDFAGTFYVFRLTAAEAARKPASLDEVRPAVEAELKKSLAFDLARAEAQSVLAAAASTDLATAAGNRQVIFTPELRFTRNQPFTNPPLTAAGLESMMRQAFDLLAVDAPPRMVIELPREGRALVAELNAVRGDIPEEFLAMAESEAANRAVSEQLELLALSWFDYYNVVQRVNYVEPGASAPATQPVTAQR